MTIIGLTGPSGSGKTLFCNLAAEFGCKSINADEVYHDLLVPPSNCLDDIVSAFGVSVINSDGTLNRGILGNIVFSDREKLSLLNSISHKFVKDEFRKIISSLQMEGCEVVIIDAPTLFESGFDKECDFTVCVIASEELRRQRISERDKIPFEKINARISAQKKEDFYTSRSNFTVINNGSVSELKKDIATVLLKMGISK